MLILLQFFLLFLLVEKLKAQKEIHISETILESEFHTINLGKEIFAREQRFLGYVFWENNYNTITNISFALQTKEKETGNWITISEEQGESSIHGELIHRFSNDTDFRLAFTNKGEKRVGVEGWLVFGETTKFTLTQRKQVDLLSNQQKLFYLPGGIQQVKVQWDSVSETLKNEFRLFRNKENMIELKHINNSTTKFVDSYQTYKHDELMYSLTNREERITLVVYSIHFVFGEVAYTLDQRVKMVDVALPNFAEKELNYYDIPIDWKYNYCYFVSNTNFNGKIQIIQKSETKKEVNVIHEVAKPFYTYRYKDFKLSKFDTFVRISSVEKDTIYDGYFVFFTEGDAFDYYLTDKVLMKDGNQTFTIGLLEEQEAIEVTIDSLGALESTLFTKNNEIVHSTTYKEGINSYDVRGTYGRDMRKLVLKSLDDGQYFEVKVNIHVNLYDPAATSNFFVRAFAITALCICAFALVLTVSIITIHLFFKFGKAKKKRKNYNQINYDEEDVDEEHDEKDVIYSDQEKVNL